MGQSGLTTGLALYEDLRALRRMWAGERADEDNARESVATTVTFGEGWDIPVADLEAAKKHGWPAARADAYPEVFPKERGLSLRSPLAWELELMEGCLRAVAAFVIRRRQDDAAGGGNDRARGLRGVEAGVVVGGRRRIVRRPKADENSCLTRRRRQSSGPRRW